VRAVLYSESRGGYINNIREPLRAPRTIWYHYAYAGGAVPANSVVTIQQYPGHAINPVTYKGVRLAGLVQINDDWNAQLTQSYQSIKADGYSRSRRNSSGVAQPSCRYSCTTLV